ncbi:MAG TPA: LuxR C-terminal-related transcriptional regulator [Candidatus Limnocylindrales bacterium]|nr:LuxR C-terminal-related transcriptional regulator [Candidatus Limnocylindrales bacterium]
MLAAERLVTLVGPPGCGKTRLALEIARRVAAQGGDVAFAELAVLGDGERVVAAVAGAAGLHGDAPLTPESLGQSLRERDLLLVLDNCEHVRTPTTRLAAGLLAACPRLRVLATSRERLGAAGERRWQVQPLSLPSDGTGGWQRSDAVRLFAERARLALPTFTLDDDTGPAVAELCRALEGLPLAIELAAARLHHISLGEIAARLDDQLRLLERAEGEDSHQRTIRAAIDWSHAFLSETERRVLRRAGVFAGSFTLAAVEAVCADEHLQTADVLPILASLVDRSLVRSDTTQSPARYSLLEVLRQYARERLIASGEADLAEERRARFFVGSFEAFNPEAFASTPPDPYGSATSPLRGFALDYPNVRGAVAWLRRHDPAAIRRILAQAWVVYVFPGPGVDQSEIEEWLGEALAADETRDALRARMLLGLSQRRMIRDPRAAAAAAEEALDIATAVGDEKARGGAYHRLAHARLAEGDRVGAAELLGRAIDFYERSSLPAAAWALATRGMVRSELGDAPGARADFEAAFAILDRFPSLARLRAIVRVFEGQHELTLGSHDAAEEAFLEVLRIFQAIGSEIPIARALEGLAIVATARGQHGRAIRLAGAADAARERGGDTLPRRRADVEALDEVTARLGSRAANLYSEGRAMPLDRAIAYGLGHASRPGGEGLTARERQIAALVARGQTNREIALQLTLSERTVENHLQHILNRLDLRSRAQIARWVAERSLAAERGGSADQARAEVPRPARARYRAATSYRSGSPVAMSKTNSPVPGSRADA